MSDRKAYLLTEKQRKLARDAVAEVSFRTDDEWHEIQIALETPVPTAQEFVDKCYERRGELLRAGFTGGANDLDGIAFVQVMHAMGLQG